MIINTPIFAAADDESGHLVRFIDYDGTVLKEQYVATGSNAIPPSNPSHTGLTFQAWNNSYTNVTRTIDCGAMYVTSDGKTHVYLALNAVSGLDIALYINKSNTATMTVDWGDGTQSTFTNSGSFNTGAHTYASYGIYDVTLWISSGTGTYALGHGTATSFVGGTTQAQREAFTELRIGSNVTGLKAYSMESCQSLKCITIPQEVTEVGAPLFRNCYKLQAIILPTSMGSTIGNATFQYCSTLKEVVIPSKVTVISTYVFFRNYSIRRCVIPAGVTSIGNDAFPFCTALRDIGPIPTTLTSLGTAFASCYELQFPAGLNLNSLTSLAGTFASCFELERINMANSTITSLPASCFQDCRNVTELTLPSGLTTLSGTYTFAGMLALASITIPASVTTMGQYTFAGNSAMDEIVMMPTTPPTLGASSFNLNGQTKIYVPDASVAAYKAATNWIAVANYIYPVSERP